MLGLRVGLVAGALSMAAGSFAGAQDMSPLLPTMEPSTVPLPAPAPVTNDPPVIQTASVPASAPVSEPAAAAQPLTAARLDQIVAPVALYPDPLLSQVLMASTYPLEVVEAARWARVPANRALSGDALTEALKPKNWDPSIMALVAFPRLLSLMADKLEWTEQLGDAFLAQQADVMATVQRLRHEAQAAGNLKVTPECHCVIQTSGETISILPAQPKMVCVPVYNPRVVYGAWSEPAYPPVVFPVPVGFAYEPGFAIGFEPVIEVAAFGPLWGWGSIDWTHRYIAVDPGRLALVSGGAAAALAGGVWVHDPAHRRAVSYADPGVTARFGAARVAAVTRSGSLAFSRPPGGPGHAAFSRGLGGPGHAAFSRGLGGPGHAAFSRGLSGPGHAAFSRGLGGPGHAAFSRGLGGPGHAAFSRGPSGLGHAAFSRGPIGPGHAAFSRSGGAPRHAAMFAPGTVVPGPGHGGGPRGGGGGGQHGGGGGGAHGDGGGHHH